MEKLTSQDDFLPLKLQPLYLGRDTDIRVQLPSSNLKSSSQREQGRLPSGLPFLYPLSSLSLESEVLIPLQSLVSFAIWAKMTFSPSSCVIPKTPSNILRAWLWGQMALAVSLGSCKWNLCSEKSAPGTESLRSCLVPSQKQHWLFRLSCLFGIFRMVGPWRLQMSHLNQSRISWTVPSSCQHSYLSWHCPRNVQEWFLKDTPYSVLAHTSVPNMPHTNL